MLAKNMHGAPDMSDLADSPYRAGRSSVAQASWRDWRTILLFGTVVTAMWLLCLSARTTLACDREAGRCSLHTQTILGTTERVIPTANLTGAGLTPVRGPRGREYLQVELFTTTGAIRLSSAAPDAELGAFARAVEQFVQGPDAPPLAVGYGSVWKRFEGYAPFFAVLLVGCLFVRPAVRVTADRATQRLVFETRALGPVLARARAYDLTTVQAATVLAAPARRRRRSRASVQLVMTDGSRVDVPVSAGSPRECQAITEKINAVLGRPTR